MKNNNQRKGLYARDKWFNLVMYAVLFLPVLWKYGVSVWYLFDKERYYSLADIPFAGGEIYFEITFVVFLFFQLLRWGNYESVRFRNGYESLPITKWNRVRYDLEIGGFMIFGMGIITTVLPTILKSVATKRYLQELKEWAKEWDQPEEYFSVEFNELFHMERYIKWGIQMQILLLVLFIAVYECVVLAKLVSRNVFCQIALAFPMVLFVLALPSRLDEICNKMEMEMGTEVAILLVLMLAVVFFFLLRLLVEKVDEAKGGTYLFRWAQLLTAFFWAGVAGITMVANIDNDRLLVLNIVITMLASVGVFTGIIYLTRAR